MKLSYNIARKERHGPSSRFLFDIHDEYRTASKRNISLVWHVTLYESHVVQFSGHLV